MEATGILLVANRCEKLWSQVELDQDTQPLSIRPPDKTLILSAIGSA